MRSGAFSGFGIGAATTLASVAIGLIVSVVPLPRDIYHAATMDKPRLDVPLPGQPWLAEKLSQKLSDMDSSRGRTSSTRRDPLGPKTFLPQWRYQLADFTQKHAETYIRREQV